jgi:hypothetical protein
VREFRPYSDAERDALLARTAAVAATSQYELFRTSSRFDSTAKRPEWLG